MVASVGRLAGHNGYTHDNRDMAQLLADRALVLHKLAAWAGDL